MPELDQETEKTEQLREIFLNVADEPVVTEAQHESHGKIKNDSAGSEALREIIREMPTEYEFKTSLSTSELAQLVRLFHDELSDTAIVREIGSAGRDKTVARARIHLQLFRETDFDCPFDLEQLRILLEEDISTADIAETLDMSKGTIREYRRLLATENAAQAVNHRYRRRFEIAITEPE